MPPKQPNDTLPIPSFPEGGHKGDSRRVYKADALLMLTALIWGTGFVAQHLGMDHVGPFTYNGVRFVLGVLLLLPLSVKQPSPVPLSMLFKYGGWAGLILFFGASFQQVGLVYTTAGKAGFITGLYVILVPFLGLFTGLHITRNAWLGAVLATVGLYFLSVTETIAINLGDLLILIGALFWAIHILFIGHIAPKVNTFQLAATQFAVCAMCSLTTAIVTESIVISNLYAATLPILYGGLLSVGVGFTLQVHAQRNAPETHAAIIFSLEAVFAALSGWIALDEQLSARELFGCVLMLLGMVIAQMKSRSR